MMVKSLGSARADIISHLITISQQKELIELNESLAVDRDQK